MRSYTILTDQDIQQARRLAEQGVSQSELCKRFSVSAPTMNRHLFSDGPLYRKCAFCGDPFPIKGKSIFCDDDCTRQSRVKAQEKLEWRAVARREALKLLVEKYKDDFQTFFEAELERNRPE